MAILFHNYPSYLPATPLAAETPSSHRNLGQEHVATAQGGVPHQTPELQDDDDGPTGIRAGVSHQVQHPERPLAGRRLRAHYEV